MREIAAVPGGMSALEAIMPVTVQEFHVVMGYVPQAGRWPPSRVPLTVLTGGESHPRFRAAADFLAARDPAITPAPCRARTPGALTAPAPL